MVASEMPSSVATRRLERPRATKTSTSVSFSERAPTGSYPSDSLKNGRCCRDGDLQPRKRHKGFSLNLIVLRGARYRLFRERVSFKWTIFAGLSWRTSENTPSTHLGD